MKRSIVFVVGHGDWGKSKTLKSLTNENWRKKYVKISNHEFFIRRMSNDDKPKGYFDFMKSLSPEKKELLIAALCPNFERENAQTEEILNLLKEKGYHLYFWVIECQFGTNEKIKPDEVSKLRDFGDVYVLSTKESSDMRAKILQTYIEEKVIA
jgi:hypothetical protein